MPMYRGLSQEDFLDIATSRGLSQEQVRKRFIADGRPVAVVDLPSGITLTLDAADGLTDTVALADVVGPFDDSLVASDAVALDDTTYGPYGIGNYGANPYGQLATGSVPGVFFTYGLVLVETAATADAVAWDDTLLGADTVALVDSGGTFDVALDLQLSDTVALADDAGTYQFDYGLPLADAATLVDSLATDSVFDLQASDSAALVDLFDPSLGIDLQASDTMALVDAVDPGFGLVLDEGVLTLVEALVTDYGLGLSDVVALVDVVVWDDTLVLADVIGLLDDGGAFSIGVTDITQADVVTLVDLLDLAQTWADSETDAVALVDAISLDLNLTFTDAMALVDAVSLAWDLAFVDALTFADSWAADEATTFTDAVALVDSLVAGFVLTLDLTDSLALVDGGFVTDLHTNWLTPIPEPGLVLTPLVEA